MTDTHKDFFAGICVGLQVLTAQDEGVAWGELVRACNVDDLLQYAAHVEPDEWELAGFKKYANLELGKRKPAKRVSAPAAVPSADSAAGWISVNDRLPTPAPGKSDSVIVACKRAHAPTRTFVFAAEYANAYQLQSRDEKEMFVTGWYLAGLDISGEFYEVYEPVCGEGDEVTHWMPMPNAPADTSTPAHTEAVAIVAPGELLADGLTRRLYWLDGVDPFQFEPGTKLFAVLPGE